MLSHNLIFAVGHILSDVRLILFLVSPCFLFLGVWHFCKVLFGFFGFEFFVWWVFFVVWVWGFFVCVFVVVVVFLFGGGYDDTLLLGFV